MSPCWPLFVPALGIVVLLAVSDARRIWRKKI